MCTIECVERKKWCCVLWWNRPITYNGRCVVSKRSYCSYTFLYLTAALPYEWKRMRARSSNTATTTTAAADIYECKQKVNMSVLLLFLWYFYECFYVLDGDFGSSYAISIPCAVHTVHYRRAFFMARVTVQFGVRGDNPMCVSERESHYAAVYRS